MALLTAIMTATAVHAAGVGVYRLGNLNTTVQNMVDRTLAKSSLIAKIRSELLVAIRQQKNTVISPDDKMSTQFGIASKEAVKKTEKLILDLQKLCSTDQNADEMAALSQLGEKFRVFIPLNNQCVDLGMQNTTVKAANLCWQELRHAIDQIIALGDKVNASDEPVQAAAPSGAKPVSAERARGSRLSYDLTRTAFSLHRTFKRMIEANSGTPEFNQLEKQSIELKERLNQTLIELLPLVPQSENAAAVAARAASNELAVEQTQLIDFARQDTTKKCAVMSLTTAREASEAVLDNLDRLATLFDAQAERARSESLVSYESGLWSIIGAAALGIALSILASILITRSVTRPVTQVRNLASAMAKGDLSHRIGLEQTDELGQLAAATDSLAESLSTIVSEIQGVSVQLAQSSTNLGKISTQLVSQSDETSTQSATVASAAEELTTNISTMAAAAEEMSMSVASISSASEEMSVNAGTISSAAEQTATNVKAVAAAVREISDTFENVLGSVREGTRVANQAVSMADTATQTVRSLTQASTEISQVTEAIKMIALQTNLLALNATIEAASAGEAGKGFAVVAHEIKELANQSARAAEGIARKIEGVQNGTRDAVTVIQGVADVIRNISASADHISTSVEKQTQAAQTISCNVGEASKGVGDIARSIAEVAKAANDISRSVSEAARGANDVSRNVSESVKASKGISASIITVGNAARATNASATGVNAAAEKLDHVAGDLRTLVGRFQLPAPHGT